MDSQLQVDYGEVEETIDPEHDLFLITISPKPRYDKGVSECYDADMYTYFHRLHKYSEVWCMSPELTQNGNIHYHGWFQIADPKGWFNYGFPWIKSHSNVKVNVAKNKKEAIKYYYKKSARGMRVMLLGQPLPVSHLNYKLYMKMLSNRLLLMHHRLDARQEKKKADEEFDRSGIVPDYEDIEKQCGIYDAKVYVNGKEYNVKVRKRNILDYVDFDSQNDE